MIFVLDRIVYKCCAHITEEDCKYHREGGCDNRGKICAFLEIEEGDEKRFLMHCSFCDDVSLHVIKGLSLDARCCWCGQSRLFGE